MRTHKTINLAEKKKLKSINKARKKVDLSPLPKKIRKYKHYLAENEKRK